MPKDATGNDTRDATESAAENATADDTVSATEIITEGSYRTRILKFLERGESHISEIVKGVGGKDRYVKSQVKALEDTGEVVRVKRGTYKLSKRPLMRSEDQNSDTINRILNLYDKVLDKYSGLIEAMLAGNDTDIEGKAKLLNNFKSLASMVDPLMKRWYLVHRGYDSNSRQAQEDAKANARKAEKEEIENASLEDQITEVAHYDVTVKELFDNLPKPEQEDRTV